MPVAMLLYAHDYSIHALDAVSGSWCIQSMCAKVDWSDPDQPVLITSPVTLHWPVHLTVIRQNTPAASLQCHRNGSGRARLVHYSGQLSARLIHYSEVFLLKNVDLRA